MNELNALQEMIDKANAVRKNAYVPISDFPVGACIRVPNDRLYVGCNIENASLAMTICAESAAIANMISGGDNKISELIIIAEKLEKCPPCGACRQRIYEFSMPQTKIYLCSKGGNIKNIFNIEQLLAEPFHIEWSGFK